VVRRAALEQLGVGRHGRDRGAQLVRRVGDELAQVPIRFLQPGLGGHPGRERRLDPLQHDVEGAGQPTDLGRLVGPGDALIEIARRDGVGRALDVFERAQAEPDQPPAPGQGQHERAGRHGQFNEERVCSVLVVPPMGSATTLRTLIPAARGPVLAVTLVTWTRNGGPPLWSSWR
jgi:hypothetical protein